MFSVTPCYEETFDLLPKIITIIEICVLYKSQQRRLLGIQNIFGNQNFIDTHASTPWQTKEYKSSSNDAFSTSALSQVFFFLVNQMKI